MPPGVPLIVDQAWGAHLGFHPALPTHAIARGADGMVTSTHKNLTAFTQGSIVLARGERIDLARLDECFELLHTTSPSAAIMASSDRARALVEERGPELLGRTIEIVADARERLSQVEGLTVVDADDPTKLVLALAGTGADGFEVERDLLGRGVRLEMADRDTLVPIVTLADTAETVGRLVDGVADSIAARRGEPRPRGRVDRLVAGRRGGDEPRAMPTSRRAGGWPWREAVGRIAAETAAPYPPGIPALAPGELISRRSWTRCAPRPRPAAGSRTAAIRRWRRCWSSTRSGNRGGRGAVTPGMRMMLLGVAIMLGRRRMRRDDGRCRRRPARRRRCCPTSPLSPAPRTARSC